ncbi:hypothetical protein ACLMJK_001764 [Lecanora helva]
MATEPYAPFNKVPPEILLNILSQIHHDSLLSVKLVSKVFFTYVTAASHQRLEYNNREFSAWCRYHTEIEASLPRGRPLNCCICTHCGRVKDTHLFTDTQARKDNPKRICIACGIDAKKYTEKVLPRVHDEYLIPCWSCKRAVPQFKNWRYTLSLARHQFRIPPSASAAEMYSMMYGAYCKPCLEEKIGSPIAKLHARAGARSAARRGELVTVEDMSLRRVILHGVTLDNGPGYFKL